MEQREDFGAEVRPPGVAHFPALVSVPAVRW